MPLPVASLISAGASVLGTGLSALSTNRANRQNRSFQEDMYNRQKQDSLDFWHLQNQYNTPQAQMNRMKEAGLSPILPFLGGSGISGSNAQAISTPQRGQYDHKTPDFSGVSQAGTRAIDAMYSMELKGAQLDNLKAQNSNIFADSALKAANAIRSGVSTEGEKLRNSQFGQLIDTNVEAAKQALRQSTMQNDLTLERHEMAKAANASNLAEAAERITMSRLEQSLGKYRAEEYREKIKSMVQQQRLNDFELKLNQFGQTKNDDMIWRILGTLTDSIMSKLGVPKY